VKLELELSRSDHETIMGQKIWVLPNSCIWRYCTCTWNSQYNRVRLVEIIFENA